MTNIRRYFQAGNLHYLTHVTASRLPILVNNFNLLWRVLEATRAKQLFDSVAWVVLTDHTHLLIDPLQCDLSRVMRKIKLAFSTKYRESIKLASGRVWQNRFWDHCIRDQKDLNQHVDYIHYNPVKHGLVSAPGDYPYSSFPEYRDQGYYSDDWGVREAIVTEGLFGE
ncbi:MAG: transposase [Candidatus Zixiibacteriota bacterium]